MLKKRVPLGRLHPVAVWLILLAVVFAAEYAVMMWLPRLMPRHSSWILESAVDAVALTCVLAPVLWWTLVRPLQEVIRLRTQFLADLLTQIENDRRQTARELHDGVGQSLTFLISGLRSAKSCQAVEDCAGRVSGFLRLAENALKEVRRLSLGLRPSLLDDLGLVQALERLVEDTRNHHAINVSLDVAGVVGLQLPEQVATAVFRIIQEALANIIKHSQARQATVIVRQTARHVHVEVSDDGRGIDPAHLRVVSTGRMGLMGMRERASLLEGEFSLDSAQGHGTRITVSIPSGGTQRG